MESHSSGSISVKNIYIVLCCLSLVLHLYNKVELIDGIKLFYVTVSLCFFLSFFFCQKISKLEFSLYLFLFFSFISSLISPFSGSLSIFATLVFLIIAFRGLAIVDGKIILMCMACLTPFVVMSMYYLYFKEPTYRFQGYYNDPNYFTLTLNAFLLANLMASFISKLKIIKMLLLLNALAILPLIMLTLSRTGVVTTLLIILCYFVERYFQAKKMTYFIVFIIFLSFVCKDFFEKNFSTQFENLIARVDGNRESTGNALSYRSRLNEAGLEILKNNPEFIAFGIGIGESANAPVLFPEYTMPHRIHNTYVSCLVEQGVLAFILFVYILCYIFTNINSRGNYLKYLRIGAWGALLMSSYSIWNINYLPFWWLIFFICNPINKYGTDIMASRNCVKINDLKHVNSMCNVS